MDDDELAKVEDIMDSGEYTGSVKDVINKTQNLDSYKFYTNVENEEDWDRLYIRNMALNGYILHVDLSPVQELVSIQQRCANNLNQVATHANSYGVYLEEIKSL